MEKNELCACPNLDCVNHGYCDKCNSRHLKTAHLNYCNFIAHLPFMEDSIKASPESPTALRFSKLIEARNGAYAKLMEKHSLTPEGQKQKLEAMTNYSEH